jgi:hypothetical protein
MDLIERLREIETRAATARKLIAEGRAAGLSVNGTTALRDVEFKARDIATYLEKQTGGPEGPPAAGLPRSSREIGA